MRVLQICSYYLGSDLYEKLFKHLEEDSINNIIYVPCHESSYVDINIEKLSGENIIISECYKNFDRLLFRFKENKIYKDMQNKINCSSFEVFHAHSLFANGYLAYKLWKKLNIPYVVAVRNTDVNVFFKRFFWLRNIGIKILCNAQKIVFISPAYKNSVIEKYVPERYKKCITHKSVVIPNGIDEFWLQHINKGRQYNVNKKWIRMVYVGSVEKNKNLETTLTVCRKLINNGYEINFGIVGGTKDENILGEALRHDFVTYYGRKTKEEIIEIMTKYDIFVMPSFYETFGLVYVEAMSQGLPVIYTKGQGFDGWFSDGTVGYSVDSSNVDEIAKKIIMICENYSEISNRCIEEAKKFNWEELAKRYKEIYSTIIECK